MASLMIRVNQKRVSCLQKAAGSGGVSIPSFESKDHKTEKRIANSLLQRNQVVFF
jgi:hypothetical protein